jgi:hypothetical protein
MNTVDVDFYVVVKADVSESGYYRNKPSVRVCKSKPQLANNEVPVLVNLSIPSALFLKPQLTANITLPSQDINQQISVNVQSDIVDAIKNIVGMNVTLNVETENENT